MGMMSWTFITLCFAFKQRELTGQVSNSMLVSVLLSGALPTTSFVDSCSRSAAGHAAAAVRSTMSLAGCLLLLHMPSIARHFTALLPFRYDGNIACKM
jgi:uncharacterized membrane protein